MSPYTLAHQGKLSLDDRITKFFPEFPELGITVTNVLGYVWPGASNTADEAAVLRVENEYLRANRERDVEALDRVLSDDFTSFGGRVTKEHRLALLSNPFFVINSLETSDVKVNVSGDDAWVSGSARMSASFRGRDFTPPQYGFTRHY